jgi:hypothetical protein
LSRKIHRKLFIPRAGSKRGQQNMLPTGRHSQLSKDSTFCF